MLNMWSPSSFANWPVGVNCYITPIGRRPFHGTSAEDLVHRILHETPDMSEIQAGMKHSLIVPVSEPHWLVQLLFILPSRKLIVRDERHGVSSPTQVTSAEVSTVECSLRAQKGDERVCRSP